jgi:alkylation response protein AidB-like acyl-CoA dehydrogenase
MKAMQTGNMMGALGQFGLDMMGYASVATQWGQRLAQDPVLNHKFATMMAR